MTSAEADDLVSAMVWCLATPPGEVTITAENIRSLLPPAAEVEAVRLRFVRLGFTVGEAYAGSFSITATRRLFIEVFQPDDGAAFTDEWFTSASEPDLELPIDSVIAADDALRRYIGGIFFSRPPDFGPGNP